MPNSKMEANSLSDITQIAANPPKYPRNPTEAKRPPLTLYIARVPGSRDIILTTLKPLLKNVTAEDVAASLYYLHLNTADDARLLEEEVANMPPEPNVPVEKPLPRKPLPESAKSSLDISRQSPVDPNSGLPKRKPVASGLDLQQANQLLERRPLGPRPLLSESSSTRKALPGVENRPSLRQEESAYAPKSSFDTTRNIYTDEKSKGQDSTKSFSITLIRRDPSSGAQWNVGTVEGNPVYGPASGRTKKPYFDMSIHLMTPGYNRFQARQTSIPAGVDVGSNNSEPSVLTPIAPVGFERTVRMGGRPTFQHARTRSEFSSKANSARDSSDSFSFGSPMLNEGSRPPTQSHATGYTFISPWQGRCQFSTSISGRTLKCKHHLPAPISAGSSSESTSAAVVSELRFNLPSGVFNSSPSPESKSRSSVESRRFSVPKFGNIRDKLNSHKKRLEDPSRLDPTSYAALYPSDEETPQLPPRPDLASHQRRSHDIRRSFNARRQSPESHSGSSEDEDDRSRLDLSIGREKAGGGNRGKRAKLGKLIIEDEGFKMLDLVVAANMSVWWSVWEGA